MIGSDDSGSGSWGGKHHPRMCRDSCPDPSSGQDEWEEERKKGGQINREQWPCAEERSGEWMETKERKKRKTLDGLFELFSAVTPRTRQEG